MINPTAVLLHSAFFSMVRLSVWGCAAELFGNFFIVSCGQIYLEGYSVGGSAAEVDISSMNPACVLSSDSHFCLLEVPHKMRKKPITSNHFQTSS